MKGKSLRSRTIGMATDFKSYPAILLNRSQTSYRQTVSHPAAPFAAQRCIFSGERGSQHLLAPDGSRILMFTAAERRKQPTCPLADGQANQTGGWTGSKCSGWGNSRCTVVSVGNNSIIHNHTRINCVSNTHNYKPTFASPCMQRYGIWL